jgi:hypothetical protein
MAGYLLNLTFEKPASANVADGLFNSNSDDPISKIWYQVPSTWPGVTYSQGQVVTQAAPITTWTQPSGFPVVDKENFSCNLNDDVYIRVLPDSSWGSVPVANLQIAFYAVFGRPSTSGHGGDTMPTPFVLQSGFGVGVNAPCSFYAWPGALPSASDNSWIFYLGKPSQNAAGQKSGGGPSNPNRLCNYSFIVGAYAGIGANNGYTYGHDPEMGVRG